MMDRETTINYMKRAVACFKADFEETCKDRNCFDCPYNYPASIVDVIESALKLLEVEEDNG